MLLTNSFPACCNVLFLSSVKGKIHKFDNLLLVSGYLYKRNCKKGLLNVLPGILSNILKQQTKIFF